MRLSLCALALLMTAGCFEAPTNPPLDVLPDGAPVDQDADGYDASVDCDDTRADVNPDQLERCNGFDDDCDGIIDPPGTVGTAPVYADTDGDGFGDPTTGTDACGVPSGFVSNADDCDDTAAGVNPEAGELCGNGVDEDCNGEVDEPEAVDATEWFADVDGDAFGDPNAMRRGCLAEANEVTDQTDCDDRRSDVNPSATEVCDGSTDEDCDGTVDEPDAIGAKNWFPDADDDSYGDGSSPRLACGPQDGEVSDDSDCDDSAAHVNPGALEVCDGNFDEDCDGVVDEDDASDATKWYGDADGDGYGDPSVERLACAGGTAEVDDNADCDDSDPQINPAAAEVCDGRNDEDCDGEVDEDDASDAKTWYGDADDDGHGDSGVSTQACNQPAGFADNPDDCADSDPGVSPSAPESCDGLDNNCDGITDFGTTVGVDVASLQEAVDAGTTDPICVAPGTYPTQLKVSGRTLSIVGIGDRESVVLDGAVVQGGTIIEDRVLEVTGGARVTVSNVTLTNGSARFGAALWVDTATATLNNVLITDFTARSTTSDPACFGGAIQSAGSSLTINNVRIESGVVECDQVYGVLSAYEGAMTVNQLAIVDVEVVAKNLFGLIYLRKPPYKLTNVLIAGNRLSHHPVYQGYFRGLILFAENGQNPVELTNWTVAHNTMVTHPNAPNDPTVHFWSETIPLRFTNVHADGIRSGGNTYFHHFSQYNPSGPQPSFQHVNVFQFDNPSTNQNITTSPGYRQDDGKFVDVSGADPTQWDLHLSSSSTLLNAGDPSIKNADGTTSDIGAYGGPGGVW